MPDDLQAMAEEFQALLKAGGGHPLGWLAGQWSFHSCFLAPYTPAFAAARQQFLVDGGGPLSVLVDQLRAQGLGVEAAVQAARQLLAAAQGLCVMVLASEHGVLGIPQPWFGTLEPRWREGAVQVLAEHFRAPAAAALGELARRDARWPRAVAGPACRDGDLAAYWLDLAHGVAQAAESFPAHADARCADLGHWAAAAVAALAPPHLEVADHAVLARCHLLAGEFASAGERLRACLGHDDEAVLELLDAYAAAAAARGGDAEAARWLEAHGGDLGCPYDVAWAKLRIAAAAGSEAIGPAVDALIAADRKLARQALMREPIWRVTAEPGALLDTGAAAELLQRSPAAVAKRLDAGTIPYCEREGQRRLPQRALLAWKAALERHGLLA